MLAHGNGRKERCAANLVQTVAGEVPYERAKGIDRNLFDSPSIEGFLLQADASRIIKIFEPRVSSCRVTVGAERAAGGAFNVKLAIE